MSLHGRYTWTRFKTALIGYKKIRFMTFSWRVNDVFNSTRENRLILSKYLDFLPQSIRINMSCTVQPLIVALNVASFSGKEAIEKLKHSNLN